MNKRSWLNRLVPLDNGRDRVRRNAAPRRRVSRRRLLSESLENRLLLTTYFIDSLADNTTVDGEITLREAIGAANSDAPVGDAPAGSGADTIDFDGLTGTIDNLLGTYAITDDLTILGSGKNDLTINGQGTTRVFSVLPSALASTPFATPTVSQLATSPEVTIEELTIAGGLATDALGFDTMTPFVFGGGLYNFGGTVHLNHVNMTGNTAAGIVTAGGAVANEFGGTLTVSHSHFEGNSSEGLLIAVGGAVTSDLGPTVDGSGTSGQPTVTIDRSSFVDNSSEAAAGYIDGVAFSGLGGGGAVLNVTGSMTITRSHFTGNSAQGGNGAVPGSTSGGPGFGGAILTGDASPFGIAESSLTVLSSSFADNMATGGPGGADDLAGGISAGGAIAVTNGSDAHLIRNNFRGNSSTGGDGGNDANGGIGTGGGVSGAGGAELSLLRNTFVENKAVGGSGSGEGSGAAGRGGALGLDSVALAGFFPGPSTAEVVSDRFERNEATGAGGGIYNEGDLSVTRARLFDNRAVGLADVQIDFYPGYSFQGAALGGGISNLGSVELSNARLIGNQAVGADGAVGLNVLLFPPGTVAPTYPGLGVGGGLHNLNEATVTGSTFTENEAVGGDNNAGSFPGVGNGGGIYNDAALTVNRSILRNNRAVGGDNNVGDINAGGGYGGGLSSGTVTALVGLRSASLDVERSILRGNDAIGGNGNSGLSPVPLAHAASGGVGGGIAVYQGTADIAKSVITRNTAVGGQGGLGAGGGVFFFGFVGTVDARLTSSTITSNTAMGGDGADGFGGGIATGSLGSLFADPSTPVKVNVSISRSFVFRNLAEGGDLGSGGSSGDGLGGGIYNGSDAALDLTRSLVFRNRAQGGSGGDGIGGGIYNLGDLNDVHSLIFANLASTSDDDCFGC